MWNGTIYWANTTSLTHSLLGQYKRRSTPNSLLHSLVIGLFGRCQVSLDLITLGLAR